MHHGRAGHALERLRESRLEHGPPLRQSVPDLVRGCRWLLALDPTYHLVEVVDDELLAPTPVAIELAEKLPYRRWGALGYDRRHATFQEPPDVLQDCVVVHTTHCLQRLDLVLQELQSRFQ